MTPSDPLAAYVSLRRILPHHAGMLVDRLSKDRPLEQLDSNRLIANAYPDTVSLFHQADTLNAQILSRTGEDDANSSELD